MTGAGPVAPLCAENGWTTGQIGRIEVKASVKLNGVLRTETIGNVPPTMSVEQFRDEYGDGDFVLVIYAPDGSKMDEIVKRNAATGNDQPRWRHQLIQKLRGQSLDQEVSPNPYGQGGYGQDPYRNGPPGPQGPMMGGHPGHSGYSFGGPDPMGMHGGMYPGQGLPPMDDTPVNVDISGSNVPIARGLAPEEQQRKIDEARREAREAEQRRSQESLSERLVSALVIPTLQATVGGQRQGMDPQTQSMMLMLQGELDRMRGEVGRLRNENTQIWNENMVLRQQLAQQPMALAQKDAEIEKLRAELQRTREGFAGGKGEQPAGSFIEKALATANNFAPMANMVAGMAQQYIASKQAPQQAQVQQAPVPSGSFPGVPPTPGMPSGGYNGNGMG